MFSVRHIENLDLPELQPYRTMRRQEEHRRQGLFVAEGEKVVRRLLESRFEVISVLLPPKWLADFTPVLEKRAEHVQVFVAEKKLLETLIGFSMYQGLLALGRVPTPKLLHEVVDQSSRPRLIVAAEGLSSAENMGSLVRNSAAFGASCLISGETCASPFLRRAVRSSMGSAFTLPIVEVLSLVEAIALLRERGVRCVAAHPRHTSVPLSSARLVADCCIVFGSEGYGLSTGVLSLCNEVASIPMAANVDSLNVSCAAAAFLYEAIRQRG